MHSGYAHFRRPAANFRHMIPARGPQLKFIYFMISIVAADSIPAFKLLAAEYSSDNQSVSVWLSYINQGTEHRATLVYKLLSIDLDT